MEVFNAQLHVPCSGQCGEHLPSISKITLLYIRLTENTLLMTLIKEKPFDHIIPNFYQ